MSYRGKIKMRLTKTEHHVFALALNSAAHKGEMTNSAAAFVRLLRKRGVTVQEFTREFRKVDDDSTDGRVRDLQAINKQLNDALAATIQSNKQLKQTVENQARLVQTLRDKLSPVPPNFEDHHRSYNGHGHSQSTMAAA
jgi:ABC-type Fe2+-enterobactin transport system substrate-binding protein